MSLTPAIREKLSARGFQRLGPGWYVKLHRKGDIQLGTAYLFSTTGAICLRTAYPISEAVPAVLASEVPRMREIGYSLGYDDYDDDEIGDDDDDDDDDDEIGYGYDDLELGARGRGRRRARRAQRQARRKGRRKKRSDSRISRRDKSEFRKRVHKAAGKLARGKVMRKLRDLKVRALQSPLAEAGMGVAAKALQAFGVPPTVTKMALNTAREAGIDRAKKGGWAGMVQRATTKGAKPGTMLREGFQRQTAAVRDSFSDVADSFTRSRGPETTGPRDRRTTRPRKKGRLSKLRRAYAIGCELAEESANA